MTYKEYRNEVEMLNGNISRICVSYDKEEILFMIYVAMSRLALIVRYRLNELEYGNNGLGE